MNWPFGWFAKKDELLPDINRVPLSPEISGIIEEYRGRRGKERLGLCLAGGGAKGAWQVGFLSRAAEVGLLGCVDVMAGTSVGGLNCLLASKYVALTPVEAGKALTSVWRGVRGNADIYRGSVPDGFMSGAWSLIQGKLSGLSFLDVTPLDNLCKKELAGAPLQVPVYVVTTDYTTKGKRVLGPGEDPVRMARATSSVPVMFPAYEGSFLDGACRDNVPFDFLLEDGITKLVVLYCDPDASKVPQTSEKPTSINTGVAALAALYNVQEEGAYRELENIQTIRKLSGLDPIEVAHFYPSCDTGGLLQFTQTGRLLQAGYDDAVTYLTPEKVRQFLCQ